MNEKMSQSLTSRDQMSQVTTGLYLGGIGAVNLEKLIENRISLVINATVELRLEPVDPEIKVVRVALRDDLNSSICPHLEPTADLIAEHLGRSGSVLVHCAAGISRSASLVIAYLIKHEHHSVRSAFELVQCVRPVIRPNNSFFEQLIQFERNLRGKTDARMVLVQRSNYAAKVPNFFLGRERLIILETIKQRLPVITSAVTASARPLL